ncbi:hypothetical protein J3A84_13935 [Proteiniclasticum sp. SCR006]|uniref:DNA binding HTH domain-containing protein n=1 Tax=Proteiniclasticum aestuarii TaxID=2817862 RepID=A0A939HCY7_9CLOT|nr:helix-turn-helix domain-containing protein [Proteiniclasticum aestuarii]MBO1266133.1 hypothetical protein [Proteiniclasticum aestuarii]
MVMLKEKLENQDDVKELQMIVNLMCYIALDLKEISCLESIAVFDTKLNTIFCENKQELKNDKDGRMMVKEYLKDHKEVVHCLRDALKTGEHKKVREREGKSALAIPIMGVKKPIGVVGIIYETDGCQKEVCTSDLLFKDIINIFIIKYREISQKEAMASMSCSLKTLEDYEKYAILETGRKCNWNISMMAKELEIGRNTLYCKMKKMGIS